MSSVEMLRESTHFWLFSAVAACALDIASIDHEDGHKVSSGSVHAVRCRQHRLLRDEYTPTDVPVALDEGGTDGNKVRMALAGGVHARCHARRGEKRVLYRKRAKARGLWTPSPDGNWLLKQRTLASVLAM